MINELTWDTRFFKRKVGELKVSSESQNEIETALKNAKEESFQYIICKVYPQKTDLTKTLESLKFYLSDIGVIWAVETDKVSYKDRESNLRMRKSIRVADENDIPVLKEIVKGLFPKSRFYNDPFFSKEEADKLYQAWIENSIKSHISDIVFFIPPGGFITCKKTASDTGEIPLIGVKKDFRGKGIGTKLVYEALKWFKTQGVHLVSARTQLKNLAAMNFYAKLGFHIKGYDLVFAKIL